MELDTGPEAAIATKRVWIQLGSPTLHQAPRLRAYGGAELPVLGQLDVSVQFHGREKLLTLVLLDSDDAVPLFGLPWIQAFDAVSLHAVSSHEKLDALLKEFSDLFDFDNRENASPPGSSLFQA